MANTYTVPTLVQVCSDVLACRVDTIRGWRFLPPFVALMVLRSHACRPGAATLERIADHHPTVPELLGDAWDKLWLSLIARKLGVESRRHPYAEAGVSSVQAWYHLLSRKKAERKAQLEARVKAARARALANPAPKRKGPRKLELRPRAERLRERKAKEHVIAARILAKQGISLPSAGRAAADRHQELGSSSAPRATHGRYTGPTHTRKVTLAAKPTPSRTSATRQAGSAAAAGRVTKRRKGEAGVVGGRDLSKSPHRSQVHQNRGSGAGGVAPGSGGGPSKRAAPFAVAVFGANPPRRLKKARVGTEHKAGAAARDGRGKEGRSGSGGGTKHPARTEHSTGRGHSSGLRRSGDSSAAKVAKAAKSHRSSGRGGDGGGSGGGGGSTGSGAGPPATKSLWAHSSRKKQRRGPLGASVKRATATPGSVGSSALGANRRGETGSTGRTAHAGGGNGRGSSLGEKGSVEAHAKARSGAMAKRKDPLGRLLGL